MFNMSMDIAVNYSSRRKLQSQLILLFHQVSNAKKLKSFNQILVYISVFEFF